MGADGGSIAKRSELVSTVDATEKSTKIEDNKCAEWTQCALTGENLEDPVVSDWNGSLYNKTAILRYLLGTLPEQHKPHTRIHQIRDVIELQRDLIDESWIDPVTRKALAVEGNSEGFAYIAECGHVSASAILLRSSNCPVCEQSYEDITIMNPQTNEAILNNRNRIEKLERLGLSHSLRPVKRKARKRNRETENPPDVKTKKVS